MADIALTMITRNPIKYNILLPLDILSCDEFGQVPAEFLSIIDIILRRINKNNLFLGVLLIICTIDHTQIQPIKSRSFLTSTNVITYFKMVVLEKLVRAGDDP